MENRKRLKIFLQIMAVVAGIALVYVAMVLIERRQGDKLAEAHREDVGKAESESVLQQAVLQFGDRQYAFSHKVKSYLIMGTDETGNEEAIGEEYEGSMADCMFVLMIDEEAKRYGVLQLNRDTITGVRMLLPGIDDTYRRDMQLCIAHAYGKDKKESCENAALAVSELLGGMPIDGYYAMKIAAMPELNREVGGVTLTIEDDLTEVDSAMTKGATIRLTDEQATKYVRLRRGIGDGENTSRMRRQRNFLAAFMEAFQKENANNSGFVVKVMEDMNSYVTTNIGGKAISKLAMNIDEYEYLGMMTPEGELTVGQTLDDGELYTEFYIDEDSLLGILDEMYPLVPVEANSITAGDE